MVNRFQDRKFRKRWLATAVLVLPALIQAFPLVYLLCVSWKEGAEVIQYPPKFFPKALNWVNYIEALDSAPLLRFLFNSALVATSITFCQLFTSILAAYALSRLKFQGQRWIMGLIVGTMMIPGEVTIIPNYFTLASWNWLNTYFALIIPFSVSGFGIFFLYQFFKTIPKELEEAAYLEGCSRLRFLFQFVVPLSWPAITAFAIYSFVGAWNQYLWPLIVTQTTEMQTAQIGIGMFRSQNESMSWGVIMAATAMLISPTVLLFIATQKQFVRGITMSGIKG